ncbi:DUF748 domain-containing protein [Pseudohongiella acticola]|uniref:DUF748 domain-containing protein n=1 Tax=Pseudohongiella acticola TaxID=1524254 RepID=UPI0009F54CDC|nr:DUF748 domain-containing protein [Pseudohongiella acticola]
MAPRDTASQNQAQAHTQAKKPDHHRHHDRRWWSRRVLLIVATLVVLLVVIRLALPSIIKSYLNRNLAEIGDYRGHIENVDLAIWRGAYVIRELDVVKLEDNVPVPFFRVTAIDLSVDWSALLRGAVVAEIDFLQPELHFVDANDNAEQAGAGTDWQLTLQQLVPITINRLSIQQGQLHFHNFQSEPPVHIVVTDLGGQFTNLSNADRSEAAVNSEFSFNAQVLGAARASVEGYLDPLGDFRDFDIDLRVLGIDLTRINDFAEAYGNFDIETGEGDFVMELQAENGQLEGYARPVLDNVAILDLSEDGEEGVLSAAWEAIVAALGQIFRNQPEDRIATEIEISGNLDNQDVSAWQAFVSILRNAFIEAYDAQFRPNQP